MTLVRRIARPLLAGVFVTGGLDALRNPESKAGAAEKVGPDVARKLPYLPEDPVQLVRINGGVQVVAGVLLAIGRFPRLAALALAASLIPTTAAGHRFWEIEDPAQRAQQKLHFLKNASMLGGLLLAAVDTEGNPSIAWRARRAIRSGTDDVKHAAKSLH